MEQSTAAPALNAAITNDKREGNRMAALNAQPSTWIFLAAFALLYVPIIINTAKIWLSNDAYSHGFLVIPCSLFLVWLQRDSLKKINPKPTLWGILPLAVGLGLQVISYILTIKYVGMWSIVPTLAGAILLMYGTQVFRICSFPVLFLVFAAPFSATLLSHMTSWLQTTSSIGATSLMTFLGYTVVHHGNVIDVPGATLEIATACSGFQSIVSMLAFTSIYSYLFTDNVFKRAVLLLLTFPIALAANVVRISVLILAATQGGMPGYHEFHDPAAIAEILVDFAVLVVIGRTLGCNNLRFAL